jgi:EAL domain-containing protein (putative c-di-GMP-specific phosphodiesterase class I)
VYGFAAGDQVIAEIAERLSGISRKSPVARRVGANQFAVIFSGIASPELLPLIGSRIVRTASESLLVGSQEIVFDVQVGLSAFPNDAWSAENLYFLAEQALRFAKRSNTAYAVHAPDELQRQRAQWRRWPELGVSVNISANALALPEAIDTLNSALRIWGVPSESLTVELTEHALARGPDACAKQLQPLREAGVRIAIDGFGTGSCSLVQFKTLRVDEIKIDRKLVSTAARSPADRLLCEHLVALAHGFGMKVVAVGVEDEPTMELFRKLGCDSAQGFMVGKSMSDDDLLTWVRDHK